MDQYSLRLGERKRTRQTADFGGSGSNPSAADQTAAVEIIGQPDAEVNGGTAHPPPRAVTFTVSGRGNLPESFTVTVNSWLRGRSP